MVNYIHNHTAQYYIYQKPWGTPRQQLERLDSLNGMKWLRTPVGKIPPEAINFAVEGTPEVYIARMSYRDSWTPGQWNLRKRVCSIAWGGEEHTNFKCEILCTPGKFVECKNTNVLLSATPAGVSEEGEPLHIGRVNYEGQYIYGKVQRSHGVCYVPIDGKERAFGAYEVFIK